MLYKHACYTHTHTRTTDLTHVLWSGEGGEAERRSGSERGSAVTLHGSPFVACCCSAQRRHFTLPALCSYYTPSPLCLLLLPPLPAPLALGCPREYLSAVCFISNSHERSAASFGFRFGFGFGICLVLGSPSILYTVCKPWGVYVVN